MNDRLESGSCSRVGISDRIGSRPGRAGERQAEAREGGVDHRAVEVRDRAGGGRCAPPAVVPLLRKVPGRLRRARHDSARVLKAAVGTAGTCRQSVTVRGLTPRPSQRRRNGSIRSYCKAKAASASSSNEAPAGAVRNRWIRSTITGGILSRFRGGVVSWFEPRSRLAATKERTQRRRAGFKPIRRREGAGGPFC